MIFGSIFNGIMARVQNLRAQEQQAKAFDMLKANETELRNLFNSEYYKDYIDTKDESYLTKYINLIFENRIPNRKEYFLRKIDE